jgi:hypothetical protein
MVTAAERKRTTTPIIILAKRSHCPGLRFHEMNEPTT